MHIKFIIFIFLLLQNTTIVSAQTKETPKFSLPLDCLSGPECFLQNLMDMQPGPERTDPFCGGATYDDHKGTDIRIKDLATLRQGIPILAVADGIVRRLRDGVEDKLMETKADRARVKGIECGNGLVIDHGKFGAVNWTSQTCHMEKNSIRVKNGDTVKRGQIIGIMGLSGETQFPHVHISLRANNKLRDFLTGNRPGSTKTKAICAVAFSDRLLTPKAIKTLNGFQSPLLQAGFANGPVKGSTVLKSKIEKPGLKGPLVFYSQFINLRAGDKIRLTINGPNGLFAKSQTKPLDKHKATYTAFTGKRGALAKGGKYEGWAELIRNNKVIFKGEPIKLQF